MRNSNWTWRAAVAALLALVFLCSMGVGDACAQSEEDGVKADAAAASHRYDLAIAISVSIGLSCLGAGYAVGRVGAAALGAASEKPELLTRGLLFVALAEGIAIYGLLIAILLWTKI
jgi:V/A-type H+-transporting ATPase subunit K